MCRARHHHTASFSSTIAHVSPIPASCDMLPITFDLWLDMVVYLVRFDVAKQEVSLKVGDDFDFAPRRA